MCGVIGLINLNYDRSFPTELLRAMANEAQIRGQHATGAAVLHDNNFLDHNVLSVPASVFPLEHLAYGYNVRAAIVHCRYSTSDLSYNQPMVAINLANYETDIALIHNGVVSQADPSTWNDTYGIECTTKNDSEILLRVYEQERHPLNIVPSSQACIVLDAIDETVSFWRNEQRPLYYVYAENYIAVASTKDILLRSGAGLPSQIKECQPCANYSVSLEEKPLRLSLTQIRLPDNDLQH
jgi:glutamine phosphoribosylpyrophosphate amidotransferase